MTSGDHASTAGTYLYELEDWEGLAVLTETHFTWLLSRKGRSPFQGEQPTDAEKAVAFDGAFAEAGTYHHVGPSRITGVRLFSTNPNLVGTQITWEYEVEGDLHRYWVLQPDGSRGPMGTSRQLRSADRARAERAIRQIVDRWFDAENRRHVEDTLGFVSQEMALQPPEHPQVEGKAAFGQFLGKLFETQVSVGGGTWRVEVAASGDLAYGIGPNRFVARGPEGEVSGTGKWLVVWRREKGEWKAAAMSYSGDGPMG